jgi:hypothetical protein
MNQSQISNEKSELKRKRIGIFYRSIYHLAYHVSTLESLLKMNAQLFIYFDRKWSANKPNAFCNEWLLKNNLGEIKWYPVRKDGLSKKILFAFREIRSYRSYLLRPDQSTFYLERWSKYLPEFFQALRRKRFSRFLLNMTLKLTPDFIFECIERLFPADRSIINFVQKLNLDVIVASPVDMRFSEEIEYVKAGKKLGIPVAVPVLSWDNLTTKGLFHSKPNLLLAWNKEHMIEAKKIHRVQQDAIVITGSPYFDKWFVKSSFSKERIQQFYSDAGINSSNPFVVYFGSSGNIATDESHLVKEFSESFLSDPSFANWQIVLRPHPSNMSHFAKLNLKNVIVWPKLNLSQKERGVPESKSDIDDFSICCQESVATIGINTSAMIESVILQKPTIAIISNHYSKTQMDSLHFKHLISSKVLYCIKKADDLKKLIQSLPETEQQMRISREKFIIDFVRPNGIESSAGHHQAKSILSLKKINQEQASDRTRNFTEL